MEVAREKFSAATLFDVVAPRPLAEPSQGPSFRDCLNPAPQGANSRTEPATAPESSRAATAQKESASRKERRAEQGATARDRQSERDRAQADAANGYQSDATSHRESPAEMSDPQEAPADAVVSSVEQVEETSPEADEPVVSEFDPTLLLAAVPLPAPDSLETMGETAGEGASAVITQVTPSPPIAPAVPPPPERTAAVNGHSSVDAQGNPSPEEIPIAAAEQAAALEVAAPLVEPAVEPPIAAEEVSNPVAASESAEGSVPNAGETSGGDAQLESSTVEAASEASTGDADSHDAPAERHAGGQDARDDSAADDATAASSFATRVPAATAANGPVSDVTPSGIEGEKVAAGEKAESPPTDQPEQQASASPSHTEVLPANLRPSETPATTVAAVSELSAVVSETGGAAAAIDPASAAAPASAPVSPRVPPALLRKGEAASRTAVQTGEIDPARFLNRVAKAFEAAQQRDSEVRLRLHPAELGALSVEVKVHEGVLTARLQAETSEARTVLLENLPQLRERLAEQGIRIEKFDVDLMDHSDRQPQQSPSDQSPQEQAARRTPTARPATPSHRNSELNTSPAAPPRANDRLNVVI